MSPRGSDPGRDARLPLDDRRREPAGMLGAQDRAPRAASKPRCFDSYDPFPAPAGRSSGATASTPGSRSTTSRSGRPRAGSTAEDPDDRAPFDLRIDVTPGDRLGFLVNMHGEIGFDTTALRPHDRLEDGETPRASKEFSGQQGRSGWRYGYLEKGRWHDLMYYDDAQTWRFKEDNATGTPFVAAATSIPTPSQDAAASGRRPEAGRCGSRARSATSGTPGCPSLAAIAWARPAMPPGTPSSIGRARTGWSSAGTTSATGRPRSRFERRRHGRASLKVAGHKQTLAPGQSVTTPKAFAALYRDDLDNAGNEFLDWQYRYLWDYTREGWFPAIRMLGYWYKGTGWGQPGVSWTGGKPTSPATSARSSASPT